MSGYGSTEAGGIIHLSRWPAAPTTSRPTPAGTAAPAGRDIEWRLDDRGVILVREREHAALFDGYVTADGIDPARDAGGWFDTGDLGRADGDDYLVFLERAAESIRVKGEFVPIPYVENHLAAVAGLSDHAVWKRQGALVDDEVVLYAVADPLPARRGCGSGSPTCPRSCGRSRWPGSARCPATRPRARCSAGCWASSRSWTGWSC